MHKMHLSVLFQLTVLI